MAEPTPPRKTFVVRAVDRTAANEESQSHPLNPNSKIVGHYLSDVVGLQRLGVHLIRVPPGKESFVYHRHFGEEEFLFILSGRGIAEIDDQEQEVGPGDFLGFPTGVAHHLRNPFAEELVYLSGGERHPNEICEFPRLGKHFARVGMSISLFPSANAEAFPGLPGIPGTKTGS
jgi:uncharacterized cupin superfamily protein